MVKPGCRVGNHFVNGKEPGLETVIDRDYKTVYPEDNNIPLLFWRPKSMKSPKQKNSKPVIRKTYEKPAVVHRELLEGLASSCGTADPVGGKESGPGWACSTTFS